MVKRQKGSKCRLLDVNNQSVFKKAVGSVSPWLFFYSVPTKTVFPQVP